MPAPFETLVFVARLTRGEKDTIFKQASAFPTSDLTSRLDSAIEEVCVDRLSLAEDCLKLARDLTNPVSGAGAGEAQLRAAVGRAYYCMHHSMRAIALWQNQWDPDGHAETIEELKKLLGNNSFRARSGLAADAWTRVVVARTNRHVADYSPYAVQRDPPDVGHVEITGRDWAAAADHNIRVAEELFEAAVRFVGS